MPSRLPHSIRSILGRFRRSRDTYERLVHVRLSREAVVHNLRTFASLRPGVAVAPVLKSNAYGHGLVEIAQCLATESFPFYVVDAYFEALALRDAGIRRPLLILGYTTTRNILESRVPDTAFGVFSLDQLRELAGQAPRPVRLHLKVDTGMHRQGLLPHELEEAYRLVQSNPKLRVEGLGSHLADADGEDERFTREQIDLWNRIAHGAREALPHLRTLHVAASAGAFYQESIDANVMRIGIGLYGMNTQPRRKLDLKPVMEIRCVLMAVKWLSPGDRVGYNGTFEAQEAMPIGIVPTGYYACVDRRRSNNGVFLVNGQPCPIVGRVSMNITTIDLRASGDARPGDEVVVLSATPDAENCAARVARECGTIPYVILTGISPQLRREVVI